MKNLTMQRVSSVWVPHFDRIAASQENLGLIETFLISSTMLITCDESWVHYLDPKSKQESSHWKSPGSP